MTRRDTYDVAIVGSGAAGGRVADDLSAAGVACVVLEAGREFGERDFPLPELQQSTRMFWGGGLEPTTDARIGLLRARCVGGTTVVNQALLDEFDDDAWNDWRSRTGIDFLTSGSMQPHYDACLAGVTTQQVAREHFNRNADLFVAAFEQQGLGWKALRRGQSDCPVDAGADCIACLGGCPRGSKQSSLVTTLARARDRGVELLSRCEVHSVEYYADHVVLHASHAGERTPIRARQAVLAAGSLGTTAILLRSSVSAQLPALGHGFTCHPQWMLYGCFDDTVDAHKGAFQAVKSHDDGLRARGVKVENVFAPPVGTAMLLPGHGRRHARRMRNYRNLASMEVAIRDEPNGRISLGKDGRPLVSKRLTARDIDRRDDGIELLRGLLHDAGAGDVVVAGDAIGLHLMGGCALGSSSTDSVVGLDFRVHGYPNLLVADSSLFPSAPGINPSLTVMALAHRAAQELVA